MKSQTVLLLLLAAVAFIAYRQMSSPTAALPANPGMNPSGGQQQQADQDLFGDILSIVKNITAAASTTIAQTSSKSV